MSTGELKACKTHEDGSLTIDNASVQRLMDYGLLHYVDGGIIVSRWPEDNSVLTRTPASTDERDELVERLRAFYNPNGGQKNTHALMCEAADAIESLTRPGLKEALEDKERLDWLQNESDDLRCFSIPTGGGDADIGWRVVGHYQADPEQRIIGEVWHDSLRDAIDNARARLKALGTYSEEFQALASVGG